MAQTPSCSVLLTRTRFCSLASLSLACRPLSCWAPGVLMAQHCCRLASVFRWRERWGQLGCICPLSPRRAGFSESTAAASLRVPVNRAAQHSGKLGKREAVGAGRTVLERTGQHRVRSLLPRVVRGRTVLPLAALARLTRSSWKGRSPTG